MESSKITEDQKTRLLAIIADLEAFDNCNLFSGGENAVDLHSNSPND